MDEVREAASFELCLPPPLPFPFLRIYFVRKIHANVRNQGWAMAGERWARGHGYVVKDAVFNQRDLLNLAKKNLMEDLTKTNYSYVQCDGKKQRIIKTKQNNTKQANKPQ